MTRRRKDISDYNANNSGVTLKMKDLHISFFTFLTAEITQTYIREGQDSCEISEFDFGTLEIFRRCLKLSRGPSEELRSLEIFVLSRGSFPRNVHHLRSQSAALSTLINHCSEVDQ